MAITVTLQDCPSGHVDAVARAVNRFRRELERQLGDAPDAALKAFQNASESSANDLSKKEIGLAQDWAKAYGAARAAGLRELGDVQEAYFEVRLT